LINDASEKSWQIRLFFFALFLCLFLYSASSAHALEEVVIPLFDITEYRLDGNFILTESEATLLLRPFTGKHKDFGTVQNAIETLEKAYRQKGFNTVQVVLPEQELERGVITLKVIETKLNMVTVTGNRYFDTANIRRSVPGLVEGKTPNVDAVSSCLRTANESPSKKTELSLQNGDQEDTINATLKVVDERPWKFSLSSDNTGDKQTGVYRLGFLFQHTNLFNLDHMLTLQYMTSFEKPSQVGIYSAGYRVPLYETGDSLEFMAAYSDVDSGTVKAGTYDLLVSGKGQVYGIRYNNNLKRIGDYEHKVTSALDYRVYQNNVSLTGIQLGNDVTVHPVSMTYTGSWSTATTVLGGYLTIIENIPLSIDGRDDDEHIKKVRAGATKNYVVFKAGANWGYMFPKGWQAVFNLTGQYTDKPLVPGEQFGVGGSTSGRGFREREVSGDWGYSFTHELYTPDLIKSDRVQWRMLVFFDRGEVEKIDPLPGESDGDKIASTGVGTRLNLGKDVMVSADYGYVLMPGASSRSKGDGFVHLKLSATY
jgi:hemolysin activation/secretion protein